MFFQLGGSGCPPEGHVHPQPPVGGGAPAACHSGACAPGPRWAGGTPAMCQSGSRDTGPRWGGSNRTSEHACVPPAPSWQGGAPTARQSGTRASDPRIPFFESTYPEMHRKHIPRVNEYQSGTSSHPVATRRGHALRSDAQPEPPCPLGARGAGAPLMRGRSPLCPQGAGGTHTGLAHSWSPPRPPGARDTPAPLARGGAPLPSRDRGRVRRSAARMFFFAFQGM